MPTAIQNVKLNPYSLQGKLLPDILSFNQLVEMLKESSKNPIADMELRFGRENEERFLGLRSEELRPLVDPETIRKHSYLDGKLTEVAGGLYSLNPTTDFQLGSLYVHGSGKATELREKIKTILVKDKVTWLNEYHDNGGNKFKPINHEKIALLASIAGVDKIDYSGLTPDEIMRMEYPIEAVHYIISRDGQVGYILSKDSIPFPVQLLIH